LYVDAHQHFWKNNPVEYGWIDESMQTLRRDFMPSDLEPELERSGFRASIAVQARQSLEETLWLLDLAARHSFIAGVVGWVDLRSPELRQQLETLCRHRKFVGVRHIVQSEPDERFLLQPDFLRGIAMLEEFALSYDILIYTRHLGVAAEFVDRFPRQRFVLDHLAKPNIRTGNLTEWRQGIRKLAKFPNVFCKVSGMVTEADWFRWKAADFSSYLDIVFESFGADRLMIGSDWPVCTVAGDYASVMNIVKDYISNLSQEERDAVLGKTAQELYRLE
jgi:L-fuconolactonase